MGDWLNSFGDIFTFNIHVAGAFCFVKYRKDVPSLEICENILKRQSTLIVPGIHLGLEGFLRIWMGAEPEFLGEGLRRIGEEIKLLIS